MMPIAGAALSDRGLRRKVNEDSYAFVPDLDLFLVADGMGGHAAGEVASRIASQAIIDKVQELLIDDDLTPLHDAHGYPAVGARRLVIAVEHANDEILRTAAENDQRRGMGTTVAALHFTEGYAHLCHVGDSRIYRIRDRCIERLTKDHAIAANVLTRALGAAAHVEATWRIEPVGPGECFVLSTDGIHGLISDEEILAIVLKNGEEYEHACRELITLANSRGGPDNSTAILVGVH